MTSKTPTVTIALVDAPGYAAPLWSTGEECGHGQRDTADHASPVLWALRPADDHGYRMTMQVRRYDEVRDGRPEVGPTDITIALDELHAATSQWFAIAELTLSPSEAEAFGEALRNAAYVARQT